MKSISLKPISLALKTSLLGFALAAAGCSSMDRHEAKSEASVPAPATVNAAAAQNASGVAEISFAKNSAQLTEEARQALVDTLNSSERAGVLADVKILAWADQDYPSTSTKKLSKPERDLAEKRAIAVRTFIKQMADVKTVDTYNMAKRPNALAQLFHTDDARLKNAMEGAGIPNSDTLTQRRASKASNAVVMFLVR